MTVYTAYYLHEKANTHNRIKWIIKTFGQGGELFGPPKRRKKKRRMILFTLLEKKKHGQEGKREGTQFTTPIIWGWEQRGVLHMLANGGGRNAVEIRCRPSHLRPEGGSDKGT